MFQVRQGWDPRDDAAPAFAVVIAAVGAGTAVRAFGWQPVAAVAVMVALAVLTFVLPAIAAVQPAPPTAEHAPEPAAAPEEEEVVVVEAQPDDESDVMRELIDEMMGE